MRNRILFRAALPALCLCLLAGAIRAAEEAQPLLTRVRMATIGTADLDGSTDLYARKLAYRSVESGRISAAQAAGWDAPAMAGRRYSLLQGDAGGDVYLRLVEISPAPGYRAMTTSGWNATEMLVSDPDAVHTRLQNSAFTHIGGPAFLGVSDTIRAVQYRGPAQEVFYFTADNGPEEGSLLARAQSAVDRVFIMVLAGGDAQVISDFYQRLFRLPQIMASETPIALIARAQGLPETHSYTLKLLSLGAFSNYIEIDGYPSAPPRIHAPGELPPGIALASFEVTDLGAIPAAVLIDAPRVDPGRAYAGARTATLRGPAGELVELIEAPPE
jgi:hypothetical protein